jgi:hypothetical protein
VSLTRRGFLGCTVGVVALAGCIGDSAQVDVCSFRDGPVGVNVQIVNTASGDPVVDEHIIAKTVSEDDESTGNYDLNGGATYRVSVTTDDGITGDYRWEVSSGIDNNRVLHVEIMQNDIEFGVSMP